MLESARVQLSGLVRHSFQQTIEVRVHVTQVQHGNQERLEEKEKIIHHTKLLKYAETKVQQAYTCNVHYDINFKPHTQKFRAGNYRRVLFRYFRYGEPQNEQLTNENLDI